MDFCLIPNTSRGGESFREGRWFAPCVDRPVDSKVKGLVLGRIEEGIAEVRTGLLPSLTVPRVRVDLLAELPTSPVESIVCDQQVELMPSARDNKKVFLKRSFGKNIPIGLRRCHPHGWINAWIQFLLYIPSVSHLFSFAPKSFDPFREFVDQYFFDQQENRNVSLAKGDSLVRCLLKTLPPYLFKNHSRVDLYEILKAFFRMIFPHLQNWPGDSKSVVFDPQSHLVWNPASGSALEEEIESKILEMPPEILVSIKGFDPVFCAPVKRQIFSPADWNFYDLDAFIEYRPDVSNEGNFITYIKINGTWYQCDDDRISPLCSSTLRVPLHRSIVLHYKRLKSCSAGN